MFERLIYIDFKTTFLGFNAPEINLIKKIQAKEIKMENLS
jgi:hypothetical protein